MIDIFKIVRSIKDDNYDAYAEKMEIAYLNALDETNTNLLQAAIAYKQDSIALDLISKGIHVNHQNAKKQTALHLAAVHHKHEIAKAILEHGGDVNLLDDHGNNALWTATMNAKGKYELVALYLTSGGDAFHKNNHGRSPLGFANQIKDEHLISLLESGSKLTLN